MAEKVAPMKAIDKAASSGAMFKLLAFSIALAVVPISSYFVSLNRFWDGNNTYAAITAVISANVVLVSYIILSVLEDQGDQARIDSAKQGLESKKNK
ncbi:hypothetical protein DL93DRAFT_2167958 [Clavulina sp. PMI_390]|nr:hypothetical protein DL93DRAFT_2167958 [Clavulina sp. PMI_390]